MTKNAGKLKGKEKNPSAEERKANPSNTLGVKGKQ
jgi:hypothetical protein